MKSKHILVVGGTRGSGLTLVRTLSKQGHTVSVIGRRAVPEFTAELTNVNYRRLDVLDNEQLTAALGSILHTHGKLSSVIFFQRYRGDDNQWAGELATSLTTTQTVIDRLAEEFRDDDDRSIVIVSSIASLLVTSDQPVGYHVAKAGLVQMARYYAVKLGPRGIRINCVSPGSVLKDEAQAFYRDNPELHNLSIQVTPLRRMGTPLEVVQVVLFLCSSQASFITGQNIVVDGGASLQWQEALARQLTSSVRPATTTEEIKKNESNSL